MTLPFTDLDSFQDPLDSILAEVALSVQLPPSLHKKTRSRFTSLREHIEAHPDFKDQIEWFYPQGSMAIDATISIDQPWRIRSIARRNWAEGF